MTGKVGEWMGLAGMERGKAGSATTLGVAQIMTREVRIMAKNKKESGEEIVIMEIQRGVVEFCLVGTSELIIHAMSEKVRKELLMPGEKKTAASKATTLKHNPIDEFLGCFYYLDDPAEGAYVSMPSVAFKKAMCQAALDIPGANKSQIGRLTYVEGVQVPIYGIPKLFMAPVRMSDIGRTPDIRTRPIFPEWACKISVGYTQPILKQQAIINLVAAAGITQGIGDGRQQKGAYSFGQFKIVPENDKDFVRICKTQGRAPQIKAIEDPECYDKDTEKMLGWFDVEVKRRGFTVVPKRA